MMVIEIPALTLPSGWRLMDPQTFTAGGTNYSLTRNDQDNSIRLGFMSTRGVHLLIVFYGTNGHVRRVVADNGAEVYFGSRDMDEELFREVSEAVQTLNNHVAEQVSAPGRT